MTLEDSQLPAAKPTINFMTLSHYPLLAPRNRYMVNCSTDRTFHRGCSYASVLLSHATLYILGDCQQIDSLKALALHKLHNTLYIFQVDKDNISDLVQLAKCAYSDTWKRHEQGIGELRTLVCQFMAMNALSLSVDERFLNLLAEGGQFVKDFLRFQVLGV